jgi:hypothetical protein
MQAPFHPSGVRNADIARLFEEIAALLELADENPFKVRAYRNAAQEIETLSFDVASGLAKGEELPKIYGVGEDLGAKIREIVQTGRCRFLEELRGRFPPGITQLLALPGLGPKRVRVLYQKLGVGSPSPICSAPPRGTRARAGGLRREEREEDSRHGGEILACSIAMAIGEICSREVVFIARNESVADAARLMRQHHIGSVVVADRTGGRIIPAGMITDRDVTVGVVALGLDAEKTPVEAAMRAELASGARDRGRRPRSPAHARARRAAPSGGGRLRGAGGTGGCRRPARALRRGTIGARRRGGARPAPRARGAAR